MVLLNIVLPVFIVFAVGFAGQKLLRLDIQPLSTIAMYLLMPFLTFQVFYEADLNASTFFLLIYAVLLTAVLLGIILIISRSRRFSKGETSGMILATVFMNGGNYGVPVALFAFGKSGLHVAVMLMVIQSLIVSTVGIFYAAKGSSRTSARKVSPWITVLKMPMTYGSFLGLVFNIGHVPMPDVVMEPVSLVANAVIPVVMILLGMQLANISLNRIAVGKVSLSLIIRLLVSPLIAVAIAWLLPVGDVFVKVMILIAAMPTAANTTMFAVKFDTRPDLVTSATLLSTLLSLVTIPLLLYFLMG